MQQLGAFDKNPSTSEDNVLPQSSPYGVPALNHGHSFSQDGDGMLNHSLPLEEFMLDKQRCLSKLYTNY